MQAKFVNEDIKKILKPKSEEEIKNIFKEQGITDDEISIRIRKPLGTYFQVRLQRFEKKMKVQVSEYKGPVPEEENEVDFLEVSGKPWKVLRFAINYFGWPQKPTFVYIEALKK
ncbi:MAG: hypothetical protein QQN41_12345 [Nitrosopumilus sp.]